MNRVHVRRRTLLDLWRIESLMDYHRLLFDQPVQAYLQRAKRLGHAPGSLLAVGASGREAHLLARHPFDRIVLTGVTEPDEVVQETVERDPRVHFEYANAERLPYASGSFDLVFCNATLHHLARPVLGLYEILRVCRRAAVFVEPWECGLGRTLERIGLATRYERNQVGNLGGRDNHVYRLNRRGLESLLRSLYLESGFELELQVGWMSTRAQGRKPRWVTRLSALAGWAASHAPGALGNLATALVVPGADLPPDPTAA